jgi:putative Mn2+ efflux pump MntP
MVELLLIALALAMDCFTVSVVCGMIVRRNEARTMLSLSFLFGLFQALMPLLGWFLARSLNEYIEAYDHWIAFAMLSLIGGKMILDAFRDEENSSINPRKAGTKVILAIATSIDALAIGISFACTGYDTLGTMVLPLILIGAVSFIMSLVGFFVGVRSGDLVNKIIKPELLGGIILIGIGIKIIIEHLG